MQVNKIKTVGSLTLFKIYFEHDDTPYPVWSIDEKRAIEDAKKISELLNALFERQLLKHK